MRQFSVLGVAISAALFLGTHAEHQGGDSQASKPKTNEKDFQTGLQSVQTLIGRQMWDPALAALRKLVAEHEGQSYVMLKYAEIEENWRRASFWKGRKVPEIKKLISGQLVSYSSDSGAVVLRYTKDTLSDFKEVSAGDSGSLLIHPARFKGPYTVEIEGDAYPNMSQKPAQLRVCDTGDQCYSISYGCAPTSDGKQQKWYPASIQELRGKEWAEVDKKEKTSAVSGKPYLLKVLVADSDISVVFTATNMLHCNKPKKLWGQFGFYSLPLKTLTIKGAIETSWLQGLVDASVQSDFAEFEKSWKTDNDMPKWIAGEAASASAHVRKGLKALPGRSTAKDVAYENALRVLLSNGKMDAATTYVAELPVSAVGEGVIHYFNAMIEDTKGNDEQALELYSKACDSDPTFLLGRGHRAATLVKLRRVPEALTEYKQLIDASPDAVDYYIVDYIYLLLSAGRAADAASELTLARKSLERNPALENLDRMVTKAQKGPDWGTRYEDSSEHYRVVSDIDRKTCYEAAQVLEDAFFHYSMTLKRPPQLAKVKFQVIIFSGKATYEAYIANLMGGAPENTAGLYSNLLKQLLIWNLPQREDMFKTIRHEGFHQYLDQLVTGAPVWLNEGLAEYYEIAKEGSTWNEGKTHPDHWRTLHDPKVELLPLKSLINLPHSKFYTQPALHYGQSWAFINFLRHGTKENKAVFAKLMNALTQPGPTARLYSDSIGDDAAIEKLEKEFVEYVHSMKTP